MSLLSHYTLVAIDKEKIVGFVDLDENYVDRLYVAKDYQRQKIATRLMDKIENYAKAYTEILKIIEYLPDSEYQKIPQKLIDQFQEKSDKEYVFEIQSEDDFENKKLLKETEYIMYALYRNYLSDEEEREKLMRLEKQAHNDSEENKRIKYNPDDIFENKDKKVTDSSEKISNEVAMTQYNKSIFKKIWNKILRIFQNG